MNAIPATCIDRPRFVADALGVPMPEGFPLIFCTWTAPLKGCAALLCRPRG